jgi:hypothetical protein
MQSSAFVCNDNEINRWDYQASHSPRHPYFPRDYHKTSLCHIHAFIIDQSTWVLHEHTRECVNLCINLFCIVMSWSKCSGIKFLFTYFAPLDHLYYLVWRYHSRFRDDFYYLQGVLGMEKNPCRHVLNLM